MNRVLRTVALGLVSAGIGVVAGGCSSSSSSSSSSSAPAGAAAGVSPVATPATTPASLSTSTLSGCPSSVLPSHYVVDAAHTGSITAKTYSASADVQAALEYDKLQAGSRAVWIHHAGKKVNGVISCISLRFGTAHLAGNFFGSYRELRSSAGSIVKKVKVKPISGATGVVGYFEKKQSFRGYHIASTNVVETAGLSGTTLFIASVAGKSPSEPLAHTLLKSLVTHA